LIEWVCRFLRPRRRRVGHLLLTSVPCIHPTKLDCDNWPTAESPLIGLGGGNQNFTQRFQKYDQEAGHAIHRGRETRLAHRKASA
jgi:hypothetical protein